MYKRQGDEKMKRLPAIILTLILVISLSACGLPSNPEIKQPSHITTNDNEDGAQQNEQTKEPSQAEVTIHETVLVDEAGKMCIRDRARTSLRRLRDRPGVPRDPPRPRPPTPAWAAVSYTHLDVYKRQASALTVPTGSTAPTRTIRPSTRSARATLWTRPGRRAPFSSNSRRYSPGSRTYSF